MLMLFLVSNCGTAFLGVKFGAAKMQSLGKGGSIIITASLASEAAYAELCAYNMSKFAVRALAVTAAQEYAKDRIRVNAVSPGFVATPLVQVWDNLEARLKATPAGEYGQALYKSKLLTIYQGGLWSRRRWQSCTCS